MPSRLLGGLGAGNAISDMTSQQIHPDIIDTYLVGTGSGWPYWNSPDGAYVTYVSANDKGDRRRADVHAVPDERHWEQHGRDQ